MSLFLVGSVNTIPVFEYFVDEEIGGHDGMVLFARHPLFKELHIGFALDEGLANAESGFKVYYGERAPWCKS